MPVIIPVLLVGGAVGLGVFWWYMRKKAPAPPTVGIGTGGGVVGITIGGGQVTGGGQGITTPDLGVIKVPDEKPPPPPVPGSDANAPLPLIVPGTYHWVQSGEVGTRIVGAAYGIPNDGTGRRFRNWEMLRTHPKNQTLKGSAFAVWDGALENRYAAPGQHPRGSGNKLPVIWIPPITEVRP